MSSSLWNLALGLSMNAAVDADIFAVRLKDIVATTADETLPNLAEAS
jgi:hypothetical protein